MNKLKVGVIGASGYAGSELVRLLLNHSKVTISGIASRSFQDELLSNLYPGFYDITTLKFIDLDEVINNSDLIFASLPHGHSEALAARCLALNKQFIDLGADFRLHNENDYHEWYGLDYQDKALHQHQVYGLSEIFTDKIKHASLIGNPGCYPTSIGLALYPALNNSLVSLDHIIIDSKSGTTGAGKSLSEATHYPRANEAFSPYKIATHRHTPEIEQTIKLISGKRACITFVPHLLPISRGIVSTIYADLNQNISIEKLHNIYVSTYQNHQFVRVLPLGSVADLKFVTYSNYCDISLHLDERNNRIILVSAIDNMIKGAAGQAIQNMNIMHGFKVNEGLNYIPPSF